MDLQPIDQIPSENAVKTFADLTAAVNGVYGGILARRDIHLTAFITDEGRLGTGTGYRNVGNILFNWMYVSDTQDFRDAEQGGIWTNLYSVIYRANRVLELMVNVPTTTTTEAALKTQYRGELLAIRAYCHFNLLRWYAETAEYTPDRRGVVVSTEAPKSPGSYFPARNKQSEVIAQVSTDLTEAKSLIPTSFTDVNRITRIAVAALQCRVALHTRQWQEVVDRATEVLAVQPITNRANYAALWTTRVLPANQSSEVIWKYAVTTANRGTYAIGSLFQDVGTGSIQLSPSQKLLNSYDQTNDIRYPTFFRPGTPTILQKYGAVVGSNGEQFDYDIKMIRSSEILLARAEAYAELNQLTPANTDLANLRTNRITGYVHTAITDKPTMISEIYLERFRELCFEGQRYHDLRRRSLPIQRDISDVVNNAAIQTMLATNPKYLLPIPQQEVFANPNIGQNPGY